MGEDVSESRKKTISVYEETWYKLWELKVKLKVKSLAEVVKTLVEKCMV